LNDEEVLYLLADGNFLEAERIGKMPAFDVQKWIMVSNKIAWRRELMREQEKAVQDGN
jgi:hypothetical protein